MVSAPFTKRISQDFIQQILSRIDIIDVINDFLSLHKIGVNYMAHCPFHNEKTPSFSVNQSKQFYHCFGCGVSGDAIQFLKEKNGLTFIESVELLAQQVGLSMPSSIKTTIYQSAPQQTEIYNVLLKASYFYSIQLRENLFSRKAIKYLKFRGINGITAKKFILGFAPPGWDNLLNSFSTQKTLIYHGVKAGLLIDRNNRFYDLFRNRIIFPIRNRYGIVVGFGGRIIDSASSEPKYLNSPETHVFNKRHELYGLYEAREEILNYNTVIIVEGYIDVLSLAQNGIKNVVSTLGTACNIHHIKQLFKIAKEVVFSFDGDYAGRKAAWRSLELCMPILDDKHIVKFLILPNKLDPDSYIREYGIEKMRRKIKQAISLPDYLFIQITQQSDVNQIDGLVQIANKIHKQLKKLPEGFLKTMLFARLGNLLKLDTNKLHKIDQLSSNRIDKFKNNITNYNNKDSNKDIIVSPAMRALSILFSHRYLLEQLPDLTGLENVDIPGCNLLCAISIILIKSEKAEDVSDDYIKECLDKKVAHMFIPAQLRGIARLIPAQGLNQEFLGAIALLRQREDELQMEALLARSNNLSDQDKIHLQKLLQKKISID